jgi:hypothetical protein
MKTVASFETSGSNYPNTRRNKPEGFLNMKTGMNLIKSSSAVSFPAGKAATFPLHYSYLLLQYYFLSVSLVVTEAT